MFVAKRCLRISGFQRFEYLQKRRDAEFCYADELLLRGGTAAARDSIKKARVSFQEAAELCKQFNAQSISGVKQNLKLSILLRKINRTQEKLDKL